jgi:hypothetical protein
LRLFLLLSLLSSSKNGGREAVVHITTRDQSFTTLNGKFLKGVSPIEVYRASIENEVGWPAFATEKVSS